MALRRDERQAARPIGPLPVARQTPSGPRCSAESGSRLATSSSHECGELANADVAIDELHRSIAEGELGTIGMKRIRFTRAFRTVVGMWKRCLANPFTIRAIDGAGPGQQSAIERGAVDAEVARGS